MMFPPKPEGIKPYAGELIKRCSLIKKTMVPNHPLLPEYSRNSKEKSLQRPPSITCGEGGCHRDQSSILHKNYGLKSSQPSGAGIGALVLELLFVTKQENTLSSS
jgi:hypothetical protein